jgi:integrase
VRKRKVNGNGQGSVYSAPDKRRTLHWRAVLTVGWTIEGKPVRRSRYAATKAAAEAELRDMIRDRDAGRPVTDPRLTLRAYLPAWLAGRTDLAPRTVESYRRGIDHAMRHLGTYRLRAITPTDVEAALAEIGGSNARITRAVLASALMDAERDGKVPRNVAKLSRPPKEVHRVIRILTAEEAQSLVEIAPTHRLGAMVTLALGTALRIGEVLGLTRDALDLDGGRMRISAQLQHPTGAPAELANPKSAASASIVHLPPFVVAALRAHLAGQAAEQIRAGRRWEDTAGLVFTTSLGRPVHDNTARFVLDVLCKRAGAERVNFHALRHTALTLATEEADQKAAQALARHTRQAATDRYAHETDALKARAAAGLQRRIGGMG